MLNMFQMMLAVFCAMIVHDAYRNDAALKVVAGFAVVVVADVGYAWLDRKMRRRPGTTRIQDHKGNVVGVAMNNAAGLATAYIASPDMLCTCNHRLSEHSHQGARRCQAQFCHAGCDRFEPQLVRVANS